MALRLSALAGGGVTIGQAVFLEDTQPSDLTIYGRRYLQSGNVEAAKSGYGVQSTLSAPNKAG